MSADKVAVICREQFDQFQLPSLTSFPLPVPLLIVSEPTVLKLWKKSCKLLNKFADDYYIKVVWSDVQ